MPFLGSQPAETALTTGNLGDDIVTEAKIANDAIGLAELKAGTDGELITWDASGNPVAVGAGTSGHFLKSQGAGSVPVFAEVATASFTRLTEQATTSGTTKDFTIPSGATEVVLVWENGSTTGTINPMLVQLGDAGGVETSSYSGAMGQVDGSTASNSSSTSGLVLCYMSNTIVVTAVMHIRLYDPATYQWISTALASHNVAGGRTTFATSIKALSAELTTVRLMNGTFDAGSVNVWHNA